MVGGGEAMTTAFVATVVVVWLFIICGGIVAFVEMIQKKPADSIGLDDDAAIWRKEGE